jgi:hypothetical protein
MHPLQWQAIDGYNIEKTMTINKTTKIIEITKAMVGNY